MTAPLGYIPVGDTGVGTDATKATLWSTTATKTGNYTAAAWQLVPCDATGGSFTITLPAANVAGQQVAVKLLATTGTNAVTVARAGSDVINSAATSVSLALADEALVFTSTGAGVWIIGQGQKSLSSLDARYQSLGLTAGEIIPRDRTRINSQLIAPTSGTLILAYFTADKTETITTLTAYSGSTAAAATPTLCRMGVYTVAANGDLTLAASTPNDTTLFAATNTAYPKALSASLPKVMGQRYATALLVVSGATMPTFHGLSMVSDTVCSTIAQLAPAVIGRVTGQTDLPSPISAGSVIGFQGIPAMLLS